MYNLFAKVYGLTDDEKVELFCFCLGWTSKSLLRNSTQEEPPNKLQQYSREV